jgi:hypothetical protein
MPHTLICPNFTIPCRFQLSAGYVPIFIGELADGSWSFGGIDYHYHLVLPRLKQEYLTDCDS